VKIPKHTYSYIIENPSASGSTYEQIMYFEAFGVRDLATKLF